MLLLARGAAGGERRASGGGGGALRPDKAAGPGTPWALRIYTLSGTPAGPRVGWNGARSYVLQVLGGSFTQAGQAIA